MNATEQQNDQQVMQRMQLTIKAVLHQRDTAHNLNADLNVELEMARARIVELERASVQLVELQRRIEAHEMELEHAKPLKPRR